MNDDGKIISIATSLLAAYTGFYSTYAGEKAPLEHYTRAASKEFMARGISVNNVAPGPMDTPFFIRKNLTMLLLSINRKHYTINSHKLKILRQSSNF